MDPVTVILAALVTGAATGLSDTAGTAVKDAYAALKSLVRARFGRHGNISEEIEAVERQPTADPVPLAEALRAAGVSNDSELVMAAHALLAAADLEGQWRTRFPQITIHDSQGVIGTNNGSVTMNFGTRD